MVLQKLLVLALQVLLEDDAVNLEVSVRISQTGFLLAVRRVEIRIVVDLPGATDASVERLRALAVSFQGVGIEQIPARLREGETALVVPKIDRLDEPLVSEMVGGPPIDLEVLLGYDSERADGGQRPAVLAIQLVDPVTIDYQFTLLATRQVEVLHQGVARIVIVPVALIVHARALVAAIAFAVLARITPSSVRHRPPGAGSAWSGCP